MPVFINVEDIAKMFETSYPRSTFYGTEVAKILRTRYGQEVKKQTVNATDGKDNRLDKDGISRS